jgi:transcriptional regulator with XRE-family HTH domain
MTDKEYLIQMGNKIRKARNTKGLYLRDLSAIVNIHISNLCPIEQGRVSCKILTLKTIADALDVDVKDFL